MPDTLKTVRPPARNVNERRGPGALPHISAAAAEAEPPDTRIFPPNEETDLPPITQAERRAAPTEEPAFTRGAARKPVPQVADPLLQWASGLQTSDRRIYAGWLVEANRLADLDDAMQVAGFQQVRIRHGNGNVVTHWAVETANVFLIAEGVQSIGEMRDPDRYGIAFGWQTQPGGRRISRLKARVFLRELLMAGYTEPLLLTLKGTLTGDLITALMRQYDVLEAAAEKRRASGKNPDLPLYAFSIPLSPGDEVMRGSGGATKEITPMIAGVPSPVTGDYLKAHWIKRAWVELVESRLDDTIAWSVAESAAIGADVEERAGWEGE